MPGLVGGGVKASLDANTIAMPTATVVVPHPGCRRIADGEHAVLSHVEHREVVWTLNAFLRRHVRLEAIA